MIIRVLHFIYLGLALVFIVFYFTVYQPFKFHEVCAEASAKTVLGTNSENDPYDFYQKLYKDCISQKSLSLGFDN